MKTCDEMMNSLLERRERYFAAQKKKRKILLSTTASLCVVALMGVALWQSGWMTAPAVTEPQDDAVDTQEPTPPTMPSYPILWGAEGEYFVRENDFDQAMTDDVDGYFSYSNQYHKKCGKNLANFLMNNEETDKIALFVRSYTYESTLFEYKGNGKTVAEYQQDQKDYETQVQRLRELVEGDGERLAQGKDAYIIESDYNSAYKRFGKELVNKYIVDGVFLAEKAEADLVALENDRTARNAYDEACRAYQRYAAAQLKTHMEQKGFDCYYTEGDEYLLFFATEDEFASLTLGVEEDRNWKYDWCTEPMPMLATGLANDRFVYNGKTVEEYYGTWRYDYYNLDTKFYNLITEEGELLEMGEDRYLTKDPNGNPWPDICGEPFTKQTYDKYVEYYGDMLTKYIVDGKFLKEKAQADWDALKNEYQEAVKRYEEAFEASRKYNADQVKEKLEQLGYECTYTEDGTGVIFHITNQDYVTLPLEVKEGGWFEWVKLNDDGTVDEEIIAYDFAADFADD